MYVKNIQWNRLFQAITVDANLVIYRKSYSAYILLPSQLRLLNNPDMILCINHCNHIYLHNQVEKHDLQHDTIISLTIMTVVLPRNLHWNVGITTSFNHINFDYVNSVIATISKKTYRQWCLPTFCFIKNTLSKTHNLFKIHTSLALVLWWTLNLCCGSSHCMAIYPPFRCEGCYSSTASKPCRNN